MSEFAVRIEELNEELTTAQIDRDQAVDEGDAERVHELDMDIERITADIKRFEMLVEKGAA